MEHMEREVKMSFRFAFAVSVFAVCVFVGCGAGGGGTAGTSGSVPTAAPTAAIQLFLVPADEASGSPILQPTPGTLGTNTVSISYTAVGQTQGLLVYEPGFTGTFSAVVQSCTLSPNAVTVSPASYTGLRQGVFVITAASAGYCVVKITDGTNGAAAFTDVTTTSGTISGVKRP
jgi:hypothetical protein